MIKGFKQYSEQRQNSVIFTFGRFNPPTVGHLKLLDKVASLADGNKYRIYASHSSDSKKNPLMYKEKVQLMRKMFPKHGRNIVMNDKIRTAIDIAVELYQEGFSEITMVVGADRITDFKKLLLRYNGIKSRHGYYNFTGGIKVVSAGQRDPDAEGVEGMSASKMRLAVVSGDFNSFQSGLPKGYPNGAKLFNLLRKRMGEKEIKNFREHVQLNPVSKKRELYARGEIFNIGDEVLCKENNIIEIKERKPNYVIDTNGHKHWLNDLHEAIRFNKIYHASSKKISRPSTHPMFFALDIKHTRSDNFTGWYYNLIQNDGKAFLYEADVKNKNKVAKYDDRKIQRLFTDAGIDLEEVYINMLLANPSGKEIQNDPGTKLLQKNGYVGIQYSDYDPRDFSKDLEALIIFNPSRDTRGFKQIAASSLDEGSHIKKRAQDKDIGDRKGSQPKTYHTGLKKSTKAKRDAQFKKQAKMSDDDPASYKPAPGDKGAKTKPSKHTKKFKQMFGEEDNPRIPRKKGQPAGSKKHSDLYTDENPKGTIKGLGFKDVETARASVRKIENSGKTHAHKIQAAIAMEQRAKVMKKTAEAAVYRKYIEKMKKITKKRNETVKSFKEMFDNAPYGEWGTEELINKYKNETPGETVILKRKDNIEEAGLWANIHKRRKSGKRMRKPGEKGAPTKKAFKSASEDVDEGIINIRNEIETIKQRLQKASKDKQKQEVARLQKTLKSLENKKKKLLRADVNEKLDPRKHDAGDYIKDFEKSDAPQFKGKSKEKIRKMAVAAYLDARDEAGIKEKTGKKPEPWPKQYPRRVVKTTKPEHKEKGYKWRIKGKERNEISIKLYKTKPSYAEFVKQMKRVAGHEFGG